MPCPTDHEAAREAAELIAKACGVDLQPYQLDILAGITARERPTAFGFDAGTDDRTVIAAATRTVDGASVSFVIVDDVWPIVAKLADHPPCQVISQKMRRRGFDWREAQRTRHKRRP